MKKSKAKTLIFLGYFLGTFFLKKWTGFSFSFFFLKLSAWELILWLGGAVLGAHLLKIDQLFYVYFVEPQEPLSFQLRQLLRQRKISQTWDLLEQKLAEQTKLATRSFLFQAAWPILALFTLTSTASWFGKALVMGIGLKLLIEEWENILAGQNISWLFWQIKREIPLKEQKVFLYIMTGIFGILSLLLI